MKIDVMGQPSYAQPQETGRRVRILIADDHPEIRKAVRYMLGDQSRFEVCGEATDGAEAVQAAKLLKPDVVVLDVTMPVLNGFEVAREIRSTLPETAIVILSGNADKVFIEQAKKIGIRCYVAKTKAGESLVKAIDAAVQGGEFVVVD
ncbi:MAG: response regulator transcription factor [Candidatus Acidiferrales bacterium]